jgi:hypothetical protein
MQGIEGYVGYRVDLNTMEKKKILPMTTIQPLI